MEGTGIRWIVGSTTGSAFMLGYLSTAQTAPMLLLGLVGGLAADRFNRKKLLLVTQFAMMLIAALLMVCSYFDYFGMNVAWVLIGISIGQGIAVAFNIPAWQVLTPRLVPRHELTAAIMLNGLQFNFARIVGPAMAGPILVWSPRHGATVLFLVNTLSFAGVLLGIAGTPDAPPPPRSEVSIWGQTQDALSFVFHNRGPRAVFLAMTIFAMLGAPLLTMMPLFVTKVYHLEADTFSTLMAILGAGAVAGVLAMRYIPAWYPKHHFIPMAITGGGVAIVLFSASPSFLLGAVCTFFAGAFWLWSFNSTFAAMQMLVDDHMRGRVMAVCNTAVFGVTPIGGLVAGVIGWAVTGDGESARGVQIGVGAMAGLLVVAGLVMLTWRTPEVDGLRPGDPGYSRQPGLLLGVTGARHRYRATGDRCIECGYLLRDIPASEGVVVCPECGHENLVEHLHGLGREQRPGADA
jgi:MFS family permease/DNA-directed RNA polymerase subunit RPC12/RpoP